MSGGGVQAQGGPMGGGKGGPQGGGKGGPQVNRGPGGNAQNNPGGVAGQTMNPSGGPFANYSNMMQGLGSGGVSQMPSPLNAAFNMPGNPVNSGPTASTWGSRNPAGMPSWASTQGLTPMGQFGQGPQPYQPSTGWVGGQPAQFAAQNTATNKPAPSPQQGILDIRNRMLYGR